MAGGLTILPRRKGGGELFQEAFNPYLQMMIQKRLNAPAEKRAEEELKLRKEQAEADALMKEFALATEMTPEETGGILGMGKRPRTMGDITATLKGLRESGFLAARVPEEDLNTFIASEEERNALKEQAPEQYNKFLFAAQKKGELTKLPRAKAVEEEVPEPKASLRLPSFKSPQVETTLPETAPPEARTGEQVGAGLRQQIGQPIQALSPQSVMGAAGQALPSAYQAGAGALRGLTGLPVPPTIPQNIMEMFRQQQQLQVPTIPEYGQSAQSAYGNIVQRIKEKYGF